MNVSVIVPMLNESAQLPDLLTELLQCKRSGCEVILVDGGSTDQSAEQASALGFCVITSARGRAKQMNAGAAAATGDILLFLHADTRLPVGAVASICEALLSPSAAWGRFNVRITGQAFMFRIIAWFMNHRSRLTGIVTGDQAIFIKRSLFEQLGGFPELPLMEDVAFSKRLKSVSRPVALKSKVTTSGRRWEEKGIWRTILLMWYLRFAYWLGASPDDLRHKYR